MPFFDKKLTHSGIFDLFLTFLHSNLMSYCFFQFRMFCDFFVRVRCVKNENKCLASSSHSESFHCQFVMFRNISKFSHLRWRQNGTEMKWNWKMKLDICSDFWHTTHKQKIYKTYQTGKNNTKNTKCCGHCHVCQFVLRKLNFHNWISHFIQI